MNAYLPETIEVAMRWPFDPPTRGSRMMIFWRVVDSRGAVGYHSRGVGGAINVSEEDSEELVDLLVVQLVRSLQEHLCHAFPGATPGEADYMGQGRWGIDRGAG